MTSPELRLIATRRGRLHTVTVQFANRVILSDTIDLSKDQTRSEFLANVVNRCEQQGMQGLDAKAMEDLRSQFDELAASAARNDRSQADCLVAIALDNYRLGKSTHGDPFAVLRRGPNVAIPLRRRGALRCELARLYFERYERAASSSSLTDALAVLEGNALRSEPEKVHLRLAQLGDSVVLDLGRTDGKVAVASGNGWTVEKRSPSLFRRTELTLELPIPERGGDLNELRDILNVTDETWPAVVGWSVACLIPDIDHPVVMLSGLHGTGKSTAARLLAMLLDPSPAPLRTKPRDEENWAVSASGSWIVVLDNISSIPPWLSDALCRAVTGDGMIRRRLFTDDDLSVLAFRRCVLITSIDAGAFRGDLGDRLVIIDLESVSPERRRSATEIEATFDACRGRVLGAVLDLVAGTLAKLPHAKRKSYPRMADYARVLDVVDHLTGLNALELFLGQRDRIAADVVEGDVVGRAALRLARAGGFTGTPSALYDMITPERPPKGWPGAPHVLTGRLKRLIPALQQVGVVIDLGRATDSTRQRTVSIRLLNDEGDEPSGASDVPGKPATPPPPTDASDASDEEEVD